MTLIKTSFTILYKKKLRFTPILSEIIEICMKPQLDAASGEGLLSAYLTDVVRTKRIVSSFPISN